jgi:Fibronectin type III domain
VRWSPPASAGSSPTSGYAVTATPGGASATVGGGQLFATIGGLTNGATYTFTVHALNTVGSGPESAPSNAVVPSAGQYLAYFSWYDPASPGMLNDNIHLVNPGAARVQGTAVLPGQAPIDFSVDPGQQVYIAFPPGAIGGPLAVFGGSRLLVDQRVQYYGSFNEVAARATAEAATDTWFPWYDLASPGMAADNLHLVNPGPAAVTGSVTVGNPVVATQSFTVPAGGTSYLGPASVIGGPLHVHASAPLLASQRVQFYQTFNEVSGRPSSDASPTLYFNWFDRASPGMLNDNVHLVNPAP